MKTGRINKHTVSMFDTAALEQALRQTNDRKKAALIQAELDSRKALGTGHRAVSIEDYLG